MPFQRARLVRHGDDGRGFYIGTDGTICHRCELKKENDDDDCDIGELSEFADDYSHIDRNYWKAKI